MSFNTDARAWKAKVKLVVIYNNQNYNITPYNSINVNFNRAINVLDSVDNANVGYVFGNRRYTFTIEVFPIVSYTQQARAQSPLRVLNDLLLKGKVFQVLLLAVSEEQDADAFGLSAANNWAYKGCQLLDCVFVSGGVGTYDSTSLQKVIRFDGLALGVSLDPGLMDQDATLTIR